jgi:hypothetical protein
MRVEIKAAVERFATDQETVIFRCVCWEDGRAWVYHMPSGAAVSLNLGTHNDFEIKAAFNAAMDTLTQILRGATL